MDHLEFENYLLSKGCQRFTKGSRNGLFQFGKAGVYFKIIEGPNGQKCPVQLNEWIPVDKVVVICKALGVPAPEMR